MSFTRIFFKLRKTKILCFENQYFNVYEDDINDDVFIISEDSDLRLILYPYLAISVDQLWFNGLFLLYFQTPFFEYAHNIFM